MSDRMSPMASERLEHETAANRFLFLFVRHSQTEGQRSELVQLAMGGTGVMCFIAFIPPSSGRRVNCSSRLLIWALLLAIDSTKC